MQAEADTLSTQVADRVEARNLGPRKLAAAKITDWTVARFGLARPVVLVSGFWRSGTTWLQEMLAEGLGAKTVFEPLSPLNPRRGEMLERAGIANPALREALILAPALPSDGVWKYLDRAFFGDYSSQFSQSCRRTAAESLRRSIVIKDVRMQFNLANVHARYGIPVIHIRRHPCAVFSSLIAQDWTWSFADVRLTDLLPSRNAGLEEFDTDLLSKVSAYWAVTEKLVDDTTRGCPWATVVSFEDALSSPNTALSTLCAFIGHERRRVPNFDAPSASNFNKPYTSASGTRKHGWRDKLSGADVERIRYVVATLYPEFGFD